MMAVAYAERGWPVFPCKPGSKIPATPNGVKDATCDLDRITKWWTRHPDCNLALATGGVADVVDIDDWDQAIESLQKLWEDAGSPEGFLSDVGAHGPAVITPSGGCHLYVAPAGLKNSVKRIPGIDIRGTGGYVVLPPSRDDRGAWCWVDGFGPDKDLPVMPAWLVAALLPVEAPRPVLMPRPATSGRYAQRALEAEIGRVVMAPVGQRNDQLFKSAAALAQLAFGGALDGSAFEALEAAAVRAGLPLHEIKRTIESGIVTGRRNPRAVS